MATMNGTESAMTLDELNAAEQRRLIPTVVYLLTISVIGIFGNSLVIHIYRTRYKQSNSKCFILCLSAIDLFSCCISIPFEVTTILNQYTFDKVWLCKCSRCFNTFGTCASAYILLFIAIDRFRKVCKPFAKQIKNTIAKYLCLLSVVLSLIMSLPAVFIYGIHTFEIPEYNLTGTECTVSDDMQGKPFPIINSFLFGILFISQIICMSVLYCCIGHEVKKHAKKMHKMSERFDKRQTSSIVEAMDSRISGSEIVADVNVRDKYDIVHTKNNEMKKNNRISIKNIKNNAYSEDSWTDKKDFELSYTTQSHDCKDGSKTRESVNDTKQVDAGINEEVELEKQNSDSEDSGIKVKDDTEREHEHINMNNVEHTNDNVNSGSGDRGNRTDVTGNTETRNVDEINLEENVDVYKDEVLLSGDGDLDEPLPFPSNESIPSQNDKTFRKRLSSISSRISHAFVRLASVVSVSHGNSSEGTMKRNQFLKQARARKTAFLMFVITLAFILSFLPHLFLMILREVMGDFVENLSDTNLAVYKFFLRSYFLNCAINPIIYSVCDSRFRSSYKTLFMSCCTRGVDK